MVRKNRLTHLTARGKRTTAMTLAGKYREKGMSKAAALKRAWKDLRVGGFLK